MPLPFLEARAFASAAALASSAAEPPFAAPAFFFFAASRFLACGIGNGQWSMAESTGGAEHILLIPG